VALRVVSLVPSVTETLLAWGVRPVGVTRFCEQPELPAVGGTKDPDVAAIVALAPDLVVMCDEENRREDAVALEAAGVVLHVVRIRAVADVSPALTGLAAAVGANVGATEPLAVAASVVQRAFIPIWRQSGGEYRTLNDDTYGASLLRAAGVSNVYGDHADRYPATTLVEAASRRPDVVLAPSEPYPFAERHRGELSDVAPVVFVDGQDLFWWGTRTPAALGRLRHAAGLMNGRRRPTG
jgi:ABC-type Fe3+-hydroxamate transport system substrate-binding protein